MCVVTTQHCNTLAVILPGQDTESWNTLQVLLLRPKILLALFDILSMSAPRQIANGNQAKITELGCWLQDIII